jgi:2-polyprenyl-6-methoxyphenol hydroxylase-like FAD-dependent oxidoreductase
LEGGTLGKSTGLIIGGGIGGLTAAIALRRAGVEVTVYERATELTEVGAGIALASNAMKVFAALGLVDRITSLGLPLASAAIRTWKGDAITKTSNAYQFMNVCVHRADLQRVLAEALGEEHLRLGYECVGFQNGSNGVIATFGNREVAAGDFLVGADGLHSVVRTQLHGAESPRYSGYTVWRGVTTSEGEPATSESWGHGKRFGIVPLGKSRVYWFATKNAPEGQLEHPQERKGELLDLFKGWHHPIADLIEATDPQAILRHDVYDRKPLRRAWGRGPVTLLGDAAHPMTPNLGQGACQAIEDALVLAQQLRGAIDTIAALRSYEAQRLHRTGYITNLSWRIGELSQWENPVLCWLRNAAFKAVPVSIQIKQLKKVVEFEAVAIDDRTGDSGGAR